MPITRTPHSLCMSTGNVTWTNMPAAATELFGLTHRRAKKDLTDVHKVRLVARVSTPGSVNAVLRAEYSVDESAWQSLTTSTLSIATPAGTKASAWDELPAGARGDVFIRVMGQSGDGTADPVVGNVYLEFI
jgi:hypothetical protein